MGGGAAGAAGGGAAGGGAAEAAGGGAAGAGGGTAGAGGGGASGAGGGGAWEGIDILPVDLTNVLLHDPSLKLPHGDINTPLVPETNI